MDMAKYFAEKKGFGVLSTADAAGRVDAAVFDRPGVLDGNRLLFVMGDNLTHANLAANPFAVYLFREEGPGYRGKRLFLKKTSENSDREEVAALCREIWPGAHAEGYCDRCGHAVYFTVEKVLPLVGAGGEGQE